MRPDLDGHSPDDSMADELEVHETFKVAAEFAPHVVVTEQTFFGHGWQPLTTSILMSLWFLPADAKFDIPFLVDWYERIGWKGANGKPLGAPVIRREIGRIREAGYVTVARLRGEKGQAVGIQYSVSQRRSDQPSDGAWIPALPGDGKSSRSGHVGALATRGQSPHVANEESSRSGHVGALATRGQSPHVANEAKPQVAPRVANGSSPPHPPEEVTTSSPNPLADTSGHMPAAPGEEEGVVFDPTETAAAARFLQTLPQPWCVGRVKAKALAPVLLETMADQGWPKLGELDDRARALLVQQLTKNPTGVRNHGSVLERDRVPNLPLFDVVAGSGAGIPAQGSGVPGPPPAADPEYKPVPPPADISAILAGLRKPTI
ncbi:hypothetical protein ACFRFJ_29970 [Streptomyces hydrogenans]|uniref:hypothetical protein n=1 Tax=Streptomyces hydrogenans TaxID=1873719 RepID=UPI0036AF15AA